VTRYLAVPLVGLVAAIPFQSSVQPLPGSVRVQVRHTGTWHPGCPVPLSQLRLLSVSYVGFDGQARTGQLVVNRSVAAPLGRVFAKLYALRFPIRHMSSADRYGPVPSRPTDGDVSASFECRQAAPSPCVGGKGTGSWSEHAFGEAVDLNPLENPYVGCGQSRDPRHPPLLQPLAAPPRDGDCGSRAGISVHRLGVGRQLDRIDEGLHAFLRDRTLNARLTVLLADSGAGVA